MMTPQLSYRELEKFAGSFYLLYGSRVQGESFFNDLLWPYDY